MGLELVGICCHTKDITPHRGGVPTGAPRKGGKAVTLCQCTTDAYRHDVCRIAIDNLDGEFVQCGEETEICLDCNKVKAADCEHWEYPYLAKAEGHP